MVTGESRQNDKGGGALGGVDDDLYSSHWYNKTLFSSVTTQNQIIAIWIICFVFASMMNLDNKQQEITFPYEKLSKLISFYSIEY